MSQVYKISKEKNMLNADIELIENYFSNSDANLFYKNFESQSNINWKEETMNMMGNEYKYARLISWYGERGKEYKFSGKLQKPNDLNENQLLLKIRNELSKECNEQFNSVLLNKYRLGSDYISWHSDNEKELGEEPVICSLSLGVTRSFRLRRFDNHSIVHNIKLNHNSVLVMRGETQHYWQHHIPKELKAHNPDMFSSFGKENCRINLTFRKILEL